MTTKEISDLLFTPFQDDASESIDPPWSVPDPGGGCGAAFTTNRIGDALWISHEASGKVFVVTIQETGTLKVLT